MHLMACNPSMFLPSHTELGKVRLQRIWEIILPNLPPQQLAIWLLFIYLSEGETANVPGSLFYCWLARTIRRLFPCNLNTSFLVLTLEMTPKHFADVYMTTFRHKKAMGISARIFLPRLLASFPPCRLWIILVVLSMPFHKWDTP